ncbi:MAG: NAD(P)-binding domain-containing protein [Muribaculaceae bacterium]|nr:NAD(P)-binding domain-containing protein [Muribaculaceae bacterium]
MKITVIGGGAMGCAVARGVAALHSVTLSTPHPDETPIDGVRAINDNRLAVSDADLVVVAVKPWVLPDVISEIAPVLPAGVELSVIVAGVKADDLMDMLGGYAPAAVSIAMPNTAMAVGESMTFLTAVEGSPERAMELFGSLGRVEVIEERLLPGATALASCGIAYALRYVRAATEGGVELGFKAAEAQRIVAQTIRGAAALLSKPGAHAEAEIDKVTTPGGITIKGLNAMEKAGFTNAVIEGLKASAK